MLDCLQDIPSLRAQLTAGYNYGGVPGKEFGVPGAVLKAQLVMQQCPYFLRTDIQSFFNRVKKVDAIDAVLKFSKDKRFNDFFRSAVMTELEDAAKHGDNIQIFPLHDEGVAQGSCLSPLLCNVMLHAFDLHMNGRGIVTIRYIDDILILGRTKASVAAAFRSAQQYLAVFGLHCYDPADPSDIDKADSGKVANGFDFLGCELGVGDVRPSESNRRDLLTKIRNLFSASLRLLKDPKTALKRHASYVDTLHLVSQTIQGWANSFGFCTDDRIMGSVDADISRSLREYSSKVKMLLAKTNELDFRRGLGVFSIRDRVTSFYSAAKERQF